MFKLNDSDIDYLTEEVYEIIWTIKDPEFPKTLEELDVVDPHNIILQINQHTKQINLIDKNQKAKKQKANIKGLL